MGKSDLDEYYELAYYTLEHPDKEYFIHQHIVDCYTAQNADDNTKPIAITFALAGLYLFVEKNYSGRQVQIAHVQLSKHNKVFPLLRPPKQRGKITISEVLEAPPGSERDLIIKKWCISVWQAYKEYHGTIAAYVVSNLSSGI